MLMNAEPNLRDEMIAKDRPRLGPAELCARVGISMRRNWPMWHEEQGPSRDWVVVGGGPSVKRCWRAIARLQELGATVVTVNKSYDAALEHGIKPWAHVLLDPQERVAGYVTKPREDTLYFVASQCHWRTFKALPRKQIRMWHATQDYDIDGVSVAQPDRYLAEHWPKHNARPIAGGTTVGHRAIMLGHLGLGADRFHLFGFDSSRGLDGKFHGYDKQELSVEDAFRGRLMMPFDGTNYHFDTNSHMARQVKDFDTFIQRLPLDYEKGTIRKAFRFIFYGSGILPFWAATLGFHADQACNENPALVGGYCDTSEGYKPAPPLPPIIFESRDIELPSLVVE
jgi:hypothetical protein